MPTMPAPFLQMDVDVDDSRQMELTGMRRLACAVLIAAVSDLQRGTTGRPSYDAAFQSAKQLLCAPNWDLEFWCALANLNQAAVIERSLQMLTTKTPHISQWQKSGRYTMDGKGAPVNYGEVALQ